MAVMEVSQMLQDAQSSNGSVRKIAEYYLKQFQELDLASFLVSLTHELGNNDKPPESRSLAGLILKNSLDANDKARKQELAMRWVALDPNVRGKIKTALAQTLSSTVADAGHTAAQVIAKIAAIELPQGEWPELVESLLANMSGPVLKQPAHVKQATVEALGYVCKEMSAEILAQVQVYSTLAAVIQGMNSSETSNDVRLAASHALNNAVEFAQTTFEIDWERDYITRVVCEATLSPDVRVREAAFECLVSIASTYYNKLAPYMQDILTITLKAVKVDSESVALQAIEFWSSICDEEIEIQQEYSGHDIRGDTEVPYFEFIKQALPALVPMLLETLTKQDEDQDLSKKGAWNLSIAGGACLSLVARVVGDDVVPLVMPFVQENISKPGWRCREAAISAFGHILEGLSLEKLTSHVNVALNSLLVAMKDENNHVRDTTAWTLARIFEFVHEALIISQTNLPVILDVLLESIEDTPNVAEMVCRAIYFLAQGYEDFGGQASSSPLSPFFQSIVEALLATTEREDSGDSRLRTAAYEALNEVVRISTEDTAPIVMQLVPLIMSKLSHTLEMAVLSSDDREKQSELHILLCSIMPAITQIISTAVVNPATAGRRTPRWRMAHDQIYGTDFPSPGRLNHCSKLQKVG